MKKKLTFKDDAALTEVAENFNEAVRREAADIAPHAGESFTPEHSLVNGIPSCHWLRFGPYGTRISVRPGPRPRIVRRVLRKNEPAGFFRAVTHA